MMKATYTYCYFGTKEERTPPAELQGVTELTIPMLHPQRTHVLTTGSVPPYRLTYMPVHTNPAWIVTLTPTPEQTEDAQ